MSEKRASLLRWLGVAFLLAGLALVSGSAEAARAPVAPDAERNVLADIVYTGCGSTLGGGGQTLAAAGAMVTSPGMCVTYCGSDDVSGELICPGQPATITFLPSPGATRCGSIDEIWVTVTDAKGVLQADGLTVNFTTSLGVITNSVGANGGRAIARLTMPSRTSGVAEITATAGRATARKSIAVSC
jgi:hypothetical protein